jgi:hypothetical protein
MASTSSNRCSAESAEHCDQPARALTIGRCSHNSSRVTGFPAITSWSIDWMAKAGLVPKVGQCPGIFIWPQRRDTGTLRRLSGSIFGIYLTPRFESVCGCWQRSDSRSIGRQMFTGLAIAARAILFELL